MKLLVTGGAGFIGSHFVQHWLGQHPGDHVVTLDRLTYSGLRATIDGLADHPRHRFLQGDVCDPDIVRQAMQGCDLVAHFAAETHVDRSITDARPFIRTNVEGTQTLLECAVKLKMTRFLHVSTDEVYGPILEGAHAETAAFSPRSPYAASKAAGDLLVRAYQATYALPAIVVRPTNAFGPRQFPEKFIPLCITNALEDAPLPLYGDGQHRRSWIFVGDLCRAIERVLDAGMPGTIYNISSASEYPNLQVARAILRTLGKPEALMTFVPDRPGHDRRYAMDGDRLSQLGWRADVAFDDGLRTTVEWYRDHPEWWQPLKARLREDPYHWLNRTARPSPRHTAGAAR
ncbi:MAG: dTDP-glucose 4,6-dehydratase [Candidatus Omnitrophica bacterium]|nr:dTDP-glucose 4,6-dehydratase [Candidatus Omnitrophota bacterium]